MSLLQREVKLAMARLVANRVQQKLCARQIADQVILKVGQVAIPATTTEGGGPPRVQTLKTQVPKQPPAEPVESQQPPAAPPPPPPATASTQQAQPAARPGLLLQPSNAAALQRGTTWGEREAELARQREADEQEGAAQTEQVDQAPAAPVQQAATGASESAAAAATQAQTPPVTAEQPAEQPDQEAPPESPEQANAEAQEALTSPPPVPEDEAETVAQSAAQMLEMDPNDPGLEAAMRGSVDEAAASFANDVVSRTTPGFMDWMTSNWQNLLVPAGIAAIAIGGAAGGTAGRIGQVLGLMAAGYGGYNLYQRWNNMTADPSQISDPTEQARIRFVQNAVQQSVLQAQQEGGQPFGDPAAAAQAAAAETGLSQEQAAQWMQQAQQAVADARLMVGLGFTGQLRERVRQSAHAQFEPVYESIRQAQGGQQQ